MYAISERGLRRFFRTEAGQYEKLKPILEEIESVSNSYLAEDSMTPPYVLQPNEEDIYDEMIFYLVQNNFGSYNECLKMTPEIFYRYKRTEVKTQAMQKLIMSVKNAKS